MNAMKNYAKNQKMQQNYGIKKEGMNLKNSYPMF